MADRSRILKPSPQLVREVAGRPAEGKAKAVLDRHKWVKGGGAIPNPGNISGGARVWLDGRPGEGLTDDGGGDVASWVGKGSEGLAFDEGPATAPRFVTVGGWTGAKSEGALEDIRSTTAITVVQPYIVSMCIRLDVWGSNERWWSIGTSGGGHQFFNRLQTSDQGFRFSLSSNINTSGVDYTTAPGFLTCTCICDDDAAGDSQFYMRGELDIHVTGGGQNSIATASDSVYLMSSTGSAKAELTVFDFALWDNVDLSTFDIAAVHAWQDYVYAGTGL